MLKQSLAEEILASAKDPKKITRAGGNSTVTRVSLGSTNYAVKNYSARADGLERLAREWWALEFLHAEKPGLSPKPLWRSDKDYVSIHSWCQGEKPNLNRHTVDGMLGILDSLLVSFRTQPTHGELPSAVDSIHEGIDLAAQIESRLRKLGRQDCLVPSKVQSHIRINLLSLTERLKGSTREDPRAMTFSPSDFGPHNLLFDRRVGSLILLDLEFFGVDDPYKLIGDAVLHPQTIWTEGLLTQFLEGSQTIFALDLNRLAQTLPLLSLKWATIIAGRLSRTSFGNQAERDSLLEAVEFYTQISMEPNLDDFIMRIVSRR